MTMSCSTVGELRSALANLPDGASIAVLYDQGADVKHQVVVRGPHVCDSECEPIDCPLAGSVVLDIDPRHVRRPEPKVDVCAAAELGRSIGAAFAKALGELR